MTAIDRIRRGTALGLVLATSACFQGVARGQAIAYQPIVGSVLDGASLTATPVVSADRRYVELTLSPYFNTVNGFSTYSAPVAAVSGGGNLAGMGGVIGGGGLTGPSGPTVGFSQTGTYRAGDFAPPAAYPGAGFADASDPFDRATSAPIGANRELAGQPPTLDEEPDVPPAFADTPEGPSVRAGKTPAARRKVAPGRRDDPPQGQARP